MIGHACKEFQCWCNDSIIFFVPVVIRHWKVQLRSLTSLQIHCDFRIWICSNIFLVTGCYQLLPPFFQFFLIELLHWRKCANEMHFPSVCTGKNYAVIFFEALLIELLCWCGCANVMCFPCVLMELLHWCRCANVTHFTLSERKTLRSCI